jgi:hypothetical protein
LQDKINISEAMILAKSSEKASTKQILEEENADRENQIHNLRKQMADQTHLLGEQRKLMNEL